MSKNDGKGSFRSLVQETKKDLDFEAFDTLGHDMLDIMKVLALIPPCKRASIQVNDGPERELPYECRQVEIVVPKDMNFTVTVRADGQKYHRIFSGSLGPVYAHTVSARRVAEVVDDRK